MLFQSKSFQSAAAFVLLLAAAGAKGQAAAPPSHLNLPPLTVPKMSFLPAHQPLPANPFYPRHTANVPASYVRLERGQLYLGNNWTLGKTDRRRHASSNGLYLRYNFGPR